MWSRPRKRWEEQITESLKIREEEWKLSKASKAFSIEIPCPLPKTGNVQCFLATHTTKFFEPKFLALLIGNIPEEDIEIVFMGLEGYVFILAVDLVTKQTPVLKLLFHSAHSVANILPLKVVSVTPDPVYKSLEYATAYLPTHVATVCGVHDKILCGDKVDLWLCQIQGDTHVDMKSKMLPNKGVTAVCTVVGTSNAITVTSYGNMYMMDVELCLNEERDSLVQMPMETDVESTESSEIFEAICSATKHLETLNYEIAKENRILEGISLAMRMDRLKMYFQVNVKVHDTGHFSSYIAEEHNPEMVIPNRLANRTRTGTRQAAFTKNFVKLEKMCQQLSAPLSVTGGNEQTLDSRWNQSCSNVYTMLTTYENPYEVHCPELYMNYTDV
uniref:Uncharacterized protein n=1 Tax=Timema cristinae TaxID=61476 RepID=A0A7R9DCN2_TIMCR|nr:unnamed protein product [Timema cristinae]